jgi:excisionase family DNA binding protein
MATMATMAMSVTDAARTLGVSVETVRRRVRSGDLPADRVATPSGWSYRVNVPTAEGEASPAPATAGPGEREAMLADQVADLRAMVATLTTLLQAREAEAAHLRRAILERLDSAKMAGAIPAPRSWWARLTGA